MPAEPPNWRSPLAEPQPAEEPKPAGPRENLPQRRRATAAAVPPARAAPSRGVSRADEKALLHEEQPSPQTPLQTPLSRARSRHAAPSHVLFPGAELLSPHRSWRCCLSLPLTEPRARGNRAEAAPQTAPADLEGRTKVNLRAFVFLLDYFYILLLQRLSA